VTKRLSLTLISVGALLLPARVAAFCYYNGEFNVRSTIQQEFAHSKWVVRARVLSARDGIFKPETDHETSWTTYQLQVVRSYKGNAPKRLNFFTERNSGGFYMDRPWVKLPAGHDIGGDYLLFLNPNRWSGTDAAPRNSVFVNYPCGQSKPWREVSQSSRRLLDHLSRGTHRPKI
jgi:hypothetical protein